jgi:hypothetical protein
MGIGDSIQQFLGLKAPSYPEPCVMGDESIMAKKAHGMFRYHYFM